MAARIYIKLPYFRVYGFTSTYREYQFVFSPPLIFLPVCVHRLALLKTFGRLPDRTSVLAWDLALVDYCLLQFHCAVPTASILHVILCLLDCDYQ